MTAVERKFRKVYCDSLGQDFGTKMQDALNHRELTWRHDARVSLSEAAALYALIPKYNYFRGEMVGNLLTSFPDAGIEVVPAREYSVAMYLHIPEEFRARVEQYIREQWGLDEMGWQAPLVGDVTGLLRVWWD